MKLYQILLSYLFVISSLLYSYDDTQINHASIYNTSSTSPAIYNQGGESTPISSPDKPNGKLDDLDVQDDLPIDIQVVPLILAAQDDNYVKIKELLNHELQYPDFDINAQDHEGKTALHYAAFHNNDQIAQLLLDSGIDINISDNEGLTALHIAADQNAFDVAQLLVNAGADLHKQTNELVKTPFDYAHNDRMKKIIEPMD